MSDMDFSTSAFPAHLAGHRLIGSRCKHCGRLFLPPRIWCPDCQQADLEAYPFSGKGKLAAYTVIFIAPTAMIAAGYDRKNPYCAGIVELDEGVRIPAQIIGVDVCHPESIRIGLPLQAAFLERSEGEHTHYVLGFQA